MALVSSFDLHINVPFINFCCLDGSILFLLWLSLAIFLLLGLTCGGNLSSIVWLLLPLGFLCELVFFAAIDERLDQIVDLDDGLSVDQFVEPDLVLQDSRLQEHILFLLSLTTVSSFCWRSVLVNFFHLLISVLGFGAIIGWLLRHLVGLLDFTKELVDFAFDDLLVFEQEDVDWDGLGGVVRVFSHTAVRLRSNLGNLGYHSN